MQTDSYAQGVPYPLLTDKPNAQTLGQGIVEGIVPRSVMRFASRSERGAVIQNPLAGMTTWVMDLGLLEVFDGRSWVTVAAGRSTWQTFPLNTSDWEHDTSIQGSFEYRVVNLFGEQTLMMKGGIRRVTAWPSQFPESFILNTTALPVEARPTNVRPFTVTCSAGSTDRLALKAEVQADGFVALYGYNKANTPPWVSFNSVFISL